MTADEQQQIVWFLRWVYDKQNLALCKCIEVDHEPGWAYVPVSPSWPELVEQFLQDKEEFMKNWMPF